MRDYLLSGQYKRPEERQSAEREAKFQRSMNKVISENRTTLKRLADQ
jgi:hypothetical protein